MVKVELRKYLPSHEMLSIQRQIRCHLNTLQAQGGKEADERAQNAKMHVRVVICVFPINFPVLFCSVDRLKILDVLMENVVINGRMENMVINGRAVLIVFIASCSGNCAGFRNSKNKATRSLP